MAYRHNDALYKHKVRAHRLRRAAFIFSGTMAVLMLVIAVDWVINRMSNSDTIVSSETTSTVQSVNVSVYRTEYFQFQASEKWVAVASESNENRFVFVKNDGRLITERLIVYIDRDERERAGDYKITNVLPVTVSELGTLIHEENVSRHCDESWPAGLSRNPSRIVHEGVSFVCAPSSAQYNVVIGEVQADEDITFQLSDGRTVDLMILYSNLTAYPGPGDIYDIVTSFRVL